MYISIGYNQYTSIYLFQLNVDKFHNTYTTLNLKFMVLIHSIIFSSHKYTFEENVRYKIFYYGICLLVIVTKESLIGINTSSLFPETRGIELGLMANYMQY